MKNKFKANGKKKNHDVVRDIADKLLMDEDTKNGAIILPKGPSRSLNEHGVYLLHGDIDEVTTGGAIRFILEANLDPDCDLEFITLIINSNGGYVSDGFALIDIMFGSHIPIRTVGIGTIASMGLMVFLAGEQGTRTLTPNCTILSHQYSGGHFGKEHELVASQKGFSDLTDIITRHYQRTTNLDDKAIRKYLLPPQDVWLTAKEAKKLGICDIVKDMKPKTIDATKKGKK
jgi:ATP-dependent Clp protease protease subunit